MIIHKINQILKFKLNQLGKKIGIESIIINIHSQSSQ